jgi:hypothetical protein
MAAHVRQQIRDALATALTGLVTTGARVFKSSTKVFYDTDLPSINIIASQEEVEALSIHQNPTQERTLLVDIFAKSAAIVDVDDVLDTICKEVEQALATNTLGGIVKQINLVSTTITQDETQDLAIGQALMQFEISYYTQANTPDVAL